MFKSLFQQFDKFLFPANWDGFRDNETSIRGYTLAFGWNVCEDLIHPHHDPHIHLPSEEHWDNRGQIYPIPQPYTKLPGQIKSYMDFLNFISLYMILQKHTDFEQNPYLIER